LKISWINSKQLAIVLPVVAAGIIVLVLITSNSQSHATVVTAAGESHLETSFGPQEDFSKGILKYYVMQELPASTAVLKRGTTITIPEVIKFWSKIPGQVVTLTNFRSDERDFGPGAGAGLTDEQFDQEINQGIPIVKEIPVRDYFSVSPTSVIIAANSTATVYVNVSIPSDYPDNMLHNALPIGIAFDTNLDSIPGFPHTHIVSEVVVEQ
jgi:hypothetical protein